MKARRIGELREFDVEGIIMNGISYVMSDVEILPTVTELSTSIDWEQRKWEASVAIYCKRFEFQPNNVGNFEDAILDAKSLIEEFKKQQKV